MAQNDKDTLIFKEQRKTPVFGIAVTGIMGAASIIGGIYFAAFDNDLLTGIVLWLVVAGPSFYTAWRYFGEGGCHTVIFDRRKREVIVTRQHRGKTESETYPFSHIANIRVDESRIHGMPCYGVTLVLRGGTGVPIVSNSLEHEDTECSDVAGGIRAFLGV